MADGLTRTSSVDIPADCKYCVWDIHGIPSLLNKYTKTNKIWLCPSDPKKQVFNPAVIAQGVPGMSVGIH